MLEGYCRLFGWELKKMQKGDKPLRFMWRGQKCWFYQFIKDFPYNEKCLRFNFCNEKIYFRFKLLIQWLEPPLVPYLLPYLWRDCCQWPHKNRILLTPDMRCSLHIWRCDALLYQTSRRLTSSVCKLKHLFINCTGAKA